MNKDTAYIGL